MARLEASASNVANVRSDGSLAASQTQATSPSGGAVNEAAYQPVRARQSEAFDGGTSFTYAPVRPGYVATYDPSSPQADAEGMIARPNVDLVDETVEQMTAKSDFMANVAVIRAADRMQEFAINLLA